jgi:hypothetical protein
MDNRSLSLLQPDLKNYYGLSIATKPYIKGYLETLYGNPIIFSRDNYFGMIMAGLLCRPVRHQHAPKVLEWRVFDKFTDSVKVYLPKWWLTKYECGHTLTNNQIITLNKLFENRFEEDLYKHCDLAIIYNVQIKKTLEDFCWQHHISVEEDISYEALQKNIIVTARKKKRIKPA